MDLERRIGAREEHAKEVATGVTTLHTTALAPLSLATSIDTVYPPLSSPMPLLLFPNGV